PDTTLPADALAITVTGGFRCF
ncbi:uncharacterized protein METZ01_LOCUS433801, partial [marine metagenome]